SAKQKNEKTVVLEKKQNNSKVTVSNQSQTDTSNISSKASANATTPTNQGHSINSIEIKGNEYKRKDNVVTLTPFQIEVSKYWNVLDRHHKEKLVVDYNKLSKNPNTPEFLDILQFCRKKDVNVFKVMEIIFYLIEKGWKDVSGNNIKNWESFVFSICKNNRYFGCMNTDLTVYSRLRDDSYVYEDEDEDYEDD
ncbi:MAG: hypothetical protein JNJ85_03635, partial [Candidatus Kapabacteria bacterium]|nr:hypothetical protein [Candidatus Kapabacteria bacterium]